MSDPITKQRSPWVESDEPSPTGYPAKWFYRRVGTGTLWACVADEPVIGWHLSISFRDHRGELSRYPTWDEILHARDELLPADVEFVMHLPVASEYVAVHRTTFHLHQYDQARQ
jgi:hypothetical protein